MDHASPLDLVPRPRHLRPGSGTVVLGDVVTVALDRELSGVWPLLSDVLGTRLGRRLVPVTGDDAHLAQVRVVHEPDLPEEGYRLEVAGAAGPGAPASGVVDDRDDHDRRNDDASETIDDDARVVLTAATPTGACHGVRTLQQLAGLAAFRATPLREAEVTLPEVVVEDEPQFEFRGVLLDVARHFMPKDQVMRFIDHASMHKLNVLHLHLSDDQGWRVEIKAYPRLTEIGSWRTESQVGSSRSPLFDGQPHGGFYTQEDLREIVAFARTRGVTVIPEIDVPGHSQAAMAAYPELSAGTAELPVWTRWGLNPHSLDTSEEVIEFFSRVLDEVMEIFDSPVICIGGDEVDMYEWRTNARIVAQAQELGLESVDDLLAWFSGRLADHARARGRRVSVWDEVGGASVARDVIVNSWRGIRSGIDALRDGHDVVVCTEHELYLDHRASPGLQEPAPVGTVHTIEEVYAFEPVTEAVAEAAAEEGAGRVLGAQAQVWREQLATSRQTDFAAYPRLAAFAEAVWSPGAGRDWADFSRRLPTHLARLDALGIEYRPMDGPRPWQQRPKVPGWPLRFDELGTLVHAPDGAA